MLSPAASERSLMPRGSSPGEAGGMFTSMRASPIVPCKAPGQLRDAGAPVRTRLPSVASGCGNPRPSCSAGLSTGSGSTSEHLSDSWLAALFESCASEAKAEKIESSHPWNTCSPSFKASIFAGTARSGLAPADTSSWNTVSAALQKRGYAVEPSPSTAKGVCMGASEASAFPKASADSQALPSACSYPANLNSISFQMVGPCTSPARRARKNAILVTVPLDVRPVSTMSSSASNASSLRSTER
eukprot:scaffold607_cov112-Isochrysis_galbana.AAC.3